MILCRTLVVLLLLGIAGQQSTKLPDLNALSNTDIKASTIMLARTGCYGSCPAYTVTIHGDGRVEYNGKRYVKVTGAQTGRMEEAAVRGLLGEFAKAGFLSIADQYGESACACDRVCTDMATATTELSVSGTTHRVVHYRGCVCAPKALFDLEQAIDKAANTEQWTGDVSQAGPMGTTCMPTKNAK
jgi:hypothetical protein